MLVLALDTSTPAITAGVVELSLPHEVVAAHQDPGAPFEPVRVLAEDVVVDAFGHAEKLLPSVTAVLAAAGRTLAELHAVVVGLGPGPFTGLRVGVVTAASLGDALDVPVHGVPSHDGIALSVPVPEPGSDPAAVRDAALLVVTDARRREVHLSAYVAGRRIHGPAVLTPAAVDEVVHSTEIFGSAPISALRVTGPGVPLVPTLEQYESVDTGSLSRGLVLAAARELVTGAVPGPLVPLYLRRPDVSEPGAPKSTLNRSTPNTSTPNTSTPDRSTPSPPSGGRA